MICVGFSCLGTDNCSELLEGAVNEIEKMTVQDCIVDELYVTQDISDSVVENGIPSKADWDYNTIFHAEFNGDLFGGNTDFTAENYSKVIVKRREKDKYTWLSIYEQPIQSNLDFSFTCRDYYARSQVEYEYALVPISGNSSEGDYIVGDIFSEFSNVWLVDKETSIPLKYNFELNTEIYNSTKTVRTGGKKHPHIYQYGESGSVSGDITVTFYPETSAGCIDLEQAVDYRREIVDPYLYNGEPKILKHWDGRIWLVVISSNITVDESDYWRMPKYSFSFQSVGDPESQDDLYDSNLIDIKGR